MGICVTVPRDISCYSNVWYRDTPSKSTKVSVDSFNACWKHLVRIHQYPNNEIVHAKYIGFLFFKLHLEIMTFNNCLRQIEIRFTSAAGIVFINLSNFFFLSIFFFFWFGKWKKKQQQNTTHLRSNSKLWSQKRNAFWYCWVCISIYLFSVGTHTTMNLWLVCPLQLASKLIYTIHFSPLFVIVNSVDLRMH